MRSLAYMFVALCLVCLPYVDSSQAMILTMGIEDGSYCDITADVEFDLEVGQNNDSGTITVTIHNNSQVINYETMDGDGNPYSVEISPYITAFLFNLPTGVTATLTAVTDGISLIEGWGIPTATMKKTYIPSPDYHGFWSAGASVGAMFTSGDPSSGIPMGETYSFDFLLAGELALLNIEELLGLAPRFAGSGSGSGGGCSGSGNGGGSGSGSGGCSGNGSEGEGGCSGSGNGGCSGSSTEGEGGCNGSGNGGNGGCSGNGSGSGGGGCSESEVSASEEDGGEGDDGDGPAVLDWEYYFLANVKGYPEGVVDFGLLVPEIEIQTASIAIVTTPEPSTFLLLFIGIFGIAALRHRLRM